MIFVFPSWILLLLAIFLALGDLLLQIFRKVVDSNYSLSATNIFFTGLCVSQIIACTLSLFLPLNKFAFVAIIVFVLLYWMINRKRLIILLRNIWKQCANKINEQSKMGSLYLRAQFVKPFPIGYAKGEAKFDMVKVNNVELYSPQNEVCYDFELQCTPISIVI